MQRSIEAITPWRTIMSYHRRPKTTQERRANGKRNVLDFDEYEVRIRPSRNQSNLVEHWDDLQKSDGGARSWKKWRKTKWRKPQ